MDIAQLEAAPPNRHRWMTRWPIAYPHRTKAWTVRAGSAWGSVTPETAVERPASPAADRKLPGLKPALGQGPLLSYRVGRRAVVRTTSGFVKVVRPRRVAAVVAACAAGSNLECAVRLPEVVSSNDDGRLALTVVPGRSLHELLRAHTDADLSAVLRAVAHGLADFHEAPPPTDLGRRRIDGAEPWVDIVARAEPEVGRELADHAARLPTLPPVPPTRLTVVHTDLHDKNIFVDRDSVGLIDLDDLSVGVAEDDVANLGAHLRLRGLQAGASPALGAARSRYLYRCYAERRTVSWARLEAVERHTFFRLACLYRYRHAGRPLVAELLRLAVDEREDQRH